MKYPEKLTVKMSEDMRAKLAAKGNAQEFVRDAIERALNGPSRPRTAPVKGNQDDDEHLVSRRYPRAYDEDRANELVAFIKANGVKPGKGKGHVPVGSVHRNTVMSALGWDERAYLSAFSEQIVFNRNDFTLRLAA